MGAMAVHLIARTHDTRRELAMIKLVLKAPEHAHVIDVSHIRRRVDQSPDANSTELANEKERASRQRQRGPQRGEECDVAAIAREERGSVRLRARAQGYFIRNSETLRADRQRFILDPDPGPDTHARAEDKFAYRPHAKTRKRWSTYWCPPPGLGSGLARRRRRSRRW